MGGAFRRTRLRMSTLARPRFVIPAKAGIQLVLSQCLFQIRASRTWIPASGTVEKAPTALSARRQESFPAAILAVGKGFPTARFWHLPTYSTLPLRGSRGFYSRCGSRLGRISSAPVSQTLGKASVSAKPDIALPPRPFFDSPPTSSTSSCASRCNPRSAGGKNKPQMLARVQHHRDRPRPSNMCR